MPGSDRDAHGCIGSAGYSWCEDNQKCQRSWEEACGVEGPVPSISQEPETCRLLTCHGLEISCGYSQPMMCTMMYSLGDKCLQYAKCAEVDGECQQVANPKFDACKTCVQKCLQLKSDNAMQQFECEAACN